MHAPSAVSLPRRTPGGFVGAIALVLILSAAPHRSHAANNDLPDLGNPAGQTMSPAKEREIGRQFYRQVRESSALVSDLQLKHYIQSLGDRLISRNQLGKEKFTFFIIDNPGVNAFAVPGGYIGFYRGLISLTENESQLASVVAHEIAHITQHHLGRVSAKQQGVSVASTVAMIAGIIAGAKGNSQLGAATIYAGVAANEQALINFTRGHEEEADRIGIQLLANSGFSTLGMVGMFESMQRTGLKTDADDYEFLRTHPLSSRRVAEARDRANRHDNTRSIIDSLDFRLMKTRLKVLSADNPAQLQHEYAAIYAHDPNPQNNYALALTHHQLNTYEEGADYLRELQQQAPESIGVRLLQAENLMAREQTQAALDIYTELHDNYPLHYPILDAYAIALGNKDQHAKASAALRSYLFDTDKPFPEAYRQLAFHQQALGQKINSRSSMADYFLAMDDTEKAQSQLRIARRDPNISEEDRQRLSARITALEATQIKSAISGKFVQR